MRFEKNIFINDDGNGDDGDEPQVVEHNNDNVQEEVSHNEPLDEGYYDKPLCLYNQAHNTQFRV